MRKPFVILIIIIIGVELRAQLQYDNQWIFSFEDDTTSILDFRNDSLVIQKVFQDLKISVSNACISDTEGNLLFYTNGCEIRDASFTLMDNGGGLNPGDINEDQCQWGYTAGHQSILALPSASNNKNYHLFHKRIVIDTNTEIIIVNDTLFHTIIDMNLNNGLGSVVQKNQPINSTRLSNSYLNAVRENSGTGWWIISGIYNSNEYEIYFIDDNDQITSKIQSIGIVIDETDDILQTIISPQGDLYIRAFADRGIFLYDFDRVLGELSNPRHIDFTIEPKFGGAAVSPNGRFLYVNSLLELWQFDLEAEDIEDSKVLIATYDGHASPFASTFFQAQLGPDCKLYYNSNNGEDVLHVMHNPNAKGLACNFEQHGIQLHTSHGISLPYFPSYRLGTEYPVCDTTRLIPTSTYFPPPSNDQVWAVAPNPTGGISFVSSNKPMTSEGELRLYDRSGRLLFTKDFGKGLKALEINLHAYPSGIYFYQVIGGEGILHVERIVRR
ncbi:MAG: T9SS type A sorting domain-containing protein [Saprospiraceae bacterium]|nr:T9SS type A sorting domain-containing protein [Saprospiraceae bacterium]